MNVEGRRITLVADELLGFGRTGGLGTATTFLAAALGRMGHRVELLYTGEPGDVALDPDWAALYASARVELGMLERGNERTEPAFFARGRDVERALTAASPDVVVVQDLAAPAYVAMRLRQLGLGFGSTLFVVYCHGTRQWITDVARKPRVLSGALAVGVLEQACVELADVVVSPSAYLLAWMDAQGWNLPDDTRVIPYLTRSAASGEPQPEPVAARRIERITFFGRLEERKGIRPFAAGLDAVSDVLTGLELEFLGGPTTPWSPERVAQLLSEETRAALRSVSFETALDQRAALARLRRPGTLAVMPSLEDNSPNAVYECIEGGIPFVASRAGGTAELVAHEDRDRVLFAPTAEGVASALRGALTADAFPPARFAFAPDAALHAWAGVVAKPVRSAPANEPAQLGGSEWVVLHDGVEAVDDDAVDVLVRAQAASGADIVTCGITLGSGLQHYFLGDPGGLGLVSNAYGTVALARRAVLGEQDAIVHEPCWPVLARAVLSGASVVSVPRPLVQSRRPPANVATDPSDALEVLREFEQRLPRETRKLARLAAGLAAQSAPPPSSSRRRLSRLLAGR